jgi:hypothetical protein
MEMASNHRAMRERTERDALRLLCSDLIDPGTRVRLAALLKDTVFTDMLNRAIYEEIAVMGPVPGRRLRELLPGRVTLYGFPDFDLKEFLGRDGSHDEDIDHWFESLLQLSEEQPKEDKRAMGQFA